MGAASRCQLALTLLSTSLLLASAASSSEMLMTTNRFHFHAWRAPRTTGPTPAPVRGVPPERGVHRGHEPARRAVVPARREPVHRPHERGVPGRVHHAAARAGRCSRPATTRPWRGRSTPRATPLDEGGRNSTHDSGDDAFGQVPYSVD